MENELDVLQREMAKLADALEALDDEMETDVMCGIIRCLLDGLSADSIIEEYDLKQLGGV